MLIETRMRYDPDRDVVWVWPDRHAPFLVSRDTIEEVAGSTAFSEDLLLDACREHEAIFCDTAARKRDDGEIDPDGSVVVTRVDLH